jgi:hypothetical protein
MAKTHLLVLGAPRSGTTLLTAMIGRHPSAAMLNENYGWAIGDVLSKPVVGNKLCIPNHIELRQRKPRWVRFFGSWLHHRLYERGYFHYRPEVDVSIEDYLEMYPDLKVIGILRDGNAVISSIMRRGEQPQDVAVYRWRRCVDILTALSDRLGDRLFLVSFDQLVTEPEATLEAIAPFIGVSFDPVMLEGYKDTPNYSNRKIDPDKAQQRKRVDLDLEANYPETCDRYEALLAQCAASIQRVHET